MSLSSAHFGWRPSGIGTVLVVVLLPAFTALGFWQLQRADSKRAQFDQFESQADLPVVTGMPDDDVARYARVRLSGEFLPGQQFLLDNMTANGRSGYQVLTPFAPSGESRLVVVNRGWVPSSGDRTSLPEIAVADGVRVVSGQLDRLPRPGLALGSGDQPQGDSWPEVVFFPDIPALAKRLDRQMFGYQLLLDPGEPDGFLRKWGPRSMAPEQHVGYAVQWFAFAVVLVIIYVSMSLRRAAL